MQMHLDQTIVRAAEQKAAELVASGQQRAILEGAKADGTQPQFLVQRSREDITVLGSVEVEGQTFFIGLET